MKSDLTLVAKMINWFGSVYHRMTGNHLLFIHVISQSKDHKFKEEAGILTKKWGSSSSPMIGANIDSIVSSEKEYIVRFSNLINNRASFWSPLGRIIQHFAFGGNMANRKALCNYAIIHPEIFDGCPGIDADNHLLVVVGMHRSGTTLLQNLLSLDPGVRTTMTWEMMESIPPATCKEELSGGERAKKLHEDFEKTKYFDPTWRDNFNKTHYFSTDSVEEDTMILFDLYAMWYYSFFLKEIDPQLTDVLQERSDFICRYLHYFLQMLDHAYRPASHWVIKNPDHSHYLPGFLEEFPEANVIVCHRNPKSVVPSWANMLVQCLHLQIYNDFGEGLPKVWAMTEEGWGRASLQQSLRETKQIIASRAYLRETKPEIEERFLDISYSALIANPTEVIGKIYEHFGYSFTNEYKNLIQEYMEKNPKGKHGHTSYSLESYHLTEDIIEKEFEEYISHYGKYF